MTFIAQWISWVPYAHANGGSCPGRSFGDKLGNGRVWSRADMLTAVGLRCTEYGMHSLRRTKALIIYKATGNPRADRDPAWPHQDREHGSLPRCRCGGCLDTRGGNRNLNNRPLAAARGRTRARPNAVVQAQAHAAWPARYVDPADRPARAPPPGQGAGVQHRCRAIFVRDPVRVTPRPRESARVSALRDRLTGSRTLVRTAPEQGSLVNSART